MVRFLLSALAAVSLAGCGSFAALDMTGSIGPAAPAPNGHVYLFRGVGGRVASLDLDEMAEKISRTGVVATVYNFTEWRLPAEEAIKRYEMDPHPAPIILLGHSAGGDAAISFAHRLKESRVPVSLIVTFDPTRRAGEVPSNVERFVNIYQSTNVFGGGDVKAAPDFKGHFATMNLKRYWNVLHVNMLKIPELQDRVMDKIAQVTAMPPSLQGPAVPIQYVMPRELPIEIFDSGLSVTLDDPQSVDALAARYGVPAWAIADVNNVGSEAKFKRGQKVVIPRHLEAALPEPEVPIATRSPTVPSSVGSLFVNETQPKDETPAITGAIRRAPLPPRLGAIPDHAN